MEKLIKLTLVIYRFFTQRWGKIEQAAELVSDLGEELSGELKRAEAVPEVSPENSEEPKS